MSDKQAYLNKLATWSTKRTKVNLTLSIKEVLVRVLDPKDVKQVPKNHVNFHIYDLSSLTL